jgi:hypothetical protein
MSDNIWRVFFFTMGMLVGVVLYGIVLHPDVRGAWNTAAHQAYFDQNCVDESRHPC